MASAAFYADLFGAPAVESSPPFALFGLDSGVMLGFCPKHTVEPAATVGAGAAEVAFSMENKEAVESTYRTWTTRGLTILQTPVLMDFGYTFVALDPDQHRLRVFSPSTSQ